MELLGLQANDKGRAFVSRGLKIKSNFGSHCRRRMCPVSLSGRCGARGGGAAVAAELSAERTDRKNVLKHLCQVQLFQINYLAHEICRGQTSPTAMFESVLFLVCCGTEPDPREARNAGQGIHVVVVWVSEPQPVTWLGTERGWHSGAWPVRAQKD